MNKVLQYISRLNTRDMFNMLQYITMIVLFLLLWGLLKYMKWRKEVYHYLEKIGGPKAYPFVGNLYLFFGLERSDFFKVLDNLSREYGDFFRGYNGFMPVIHIKRPEHLEQIMSNSVHIKKGRVYGVVKEWLGDGLLISDGEKWHQRRKMITPTFHFKTLDGFMAVFVEKSKLLVDYLEKEGDGKGFDVYPHITHCALDIICETAMGVSINAMSDRNNKYTRAICSTTELIISKQLSLLQQTPLYPFLKNGKTFYKNLDIMHSFTKKVIADRRKILKGNLTKQEQDDDISTPRRKRLSFLDLLLDPSEILTDDDIRAEVDTFMFEGHDTTTAAMTWSLFLFGLNQDVQEKAYQEIKGVLGDRRTPETISDLNELKYLECCIKETLRLYPSVPFIGRLLTEDITIDGYKIPKGTDCNMSIYHAHRNPDIYPDPEKYDPERFLPENCKGRHPYAYIPFSAGPRNCIGQKFAILEEKTLLASILRNFKVIPVDTLETINIVFELILRPQNGLKVALEKRTD